MQHKFLIPLTVLCAAIMSACGGGGSSSTSVADVVLDGSFGKGLYRGADVQAYEVVNGNLVPTGSKTTTSLVDGSYSLSLKPTTNPVVIEMTTNASTTMLDELNGFAPVNTKPNTKMRSMVFDLKSSTSVQGNLFTEMAVESAAKAAGGLTPEVIASAKVLVQQATGIDPFAVKTIASSTATMDGSQEKLMTLQTAMMLASAAKATGGCQDAAGVNDPTGVSCLITELNAKASLTSNAGSYEMSNPAVLQGYLKTKIADLEAYVPPPSTVPANTQFLNSMKTKATVVKSALPDTIVPVSASTAKEQQGLDAFLQAMRTGFNEAEKTITLRKNSAKVRLDQYVFKHLGDGLNILGESMNACTNNSGTLTCTTTAPSIFSGATSGYTFSYSVTADGLRAPTYGAAVYKISGNITASYSTDTGLGSAVITATKALADGSKTLSEFSINFSGSGIKKDSLSATVSVNALTVKGYDQAVGSTKWGQVSLTGFSLTANRPSVGGLATLTLTAPLTLSTSDGDLINGKITNLVAKEKITNMRYTGSKDVYPVSLDASIDVAVKEGALLGIAMTASQNIDSYNPDLSSTESNPANGNVWVSFKLADNVSVSLSGSKTAYDKSNMEVKVTSSGNWINMAAKTKRANLLIDDETLDGDIVVTSSGAYNAKLRKSGGQMVGEIYNGTEKIGTVDNGIVKVAGVEVSLR